MQRVLIIGAGQGGQQAAMSLRQDGFQGDILLIGEEPGLPYQRPPLSKAYMADGDAGRLLLRPAAFYDRSAITYREALRAVEIDRKAGSVTTADGARHGYDHLILAPGARNFRPPIPGLEAEGVLELRTLADATRLRARLGRTQHAIVIGGGFIGLEFTAMARAAGVAVTVLEAAPRLMSRALSAEMSSHFLSLHQEMGTEVLLGAMASAILVDASGQAAGVALADGREIAGDLVLVATGVRPNVELAEQAGLEVQNGIVVDGALLTSDANISALGDAAAFPIASGGRVRLESVQAAVDHARHIARRLTGAEVADYAALPWFWSDQGKNKLQIAGLLQPGDSAKEVEQAGPERLVLILRDGRLVAAETVNAPAQHMAARRLVGVGVDALAEHGYDLRAAAKAGVVAG